MLPLVDNKIFENIKDRIKLLLDGTYSLDIENTNSLINCSVKNTVYRNSGFVDFNIVNSKINEFFNKERELILNTRNYYHLEGKNKSITKIIKEKVNCYDIRHGNFRFINSPFK